MKNAPAFENLVDNFQQQQPVRAGSLIITIFGDIIAPRGGTIWLGSLINLLSPLGLNERLIRTSVSRLSKDSWISPQQVGRKSYYSITPSGQHRFDTATPHIYAGPPTGWDQRWCMVILPDSLKSKKDLIKKQLGWLGFGSLSRNSLVHPMPDRTALEKTLNFLEIRDQVVLVEKADLGKTSDEALTKLIRTCWDLEQLRNKYLGFIGQFQPLQDSVPKTPEQAVLTRILMIHQYRKILLRDPLLPSVMMPAGWEGIKAHDLCVQLYQRMLLSSEKFINETLETMNGPLPAANKTFYNRFGGI